MNMHSLIYNQLNAPAYDELIRYSWHNTDPNFSREEELTRPKPLLVQDISFKSGGNKCQVDNCTQNAHIRCAHCGKLMCLKHFLPRSCFHERSLRGNGPVAGTWGTCNMGGDNYEAGTSWMSNMAEQSQTCAADSDDGVCLLLTYWPSIDDAFLLVILDSVERERGQPK